MSHWILAQPTSWQLVGAAQTTEAATLLSVKIASQALAACSSISSSPVARVLQTQALPAATCGCAGMSPPVAPGSWAAAATLVSPSKQLLCSPTRQPLASCNVPRASPACHAKRSLAALHHQQLFSSSATPVVGASGNGVSASSSNSVTKRHEHDGIPCTAAPAGLTTRQGTGPLTPAVTEPLVISHSSSMAQQLHRPAQQMTAECVPAATANTIAAAQQVPASAILESPPELEPVAAQPTDCPVHLQQQQRHKPRMSGRRVTARYDIPLGLDWLSHMPDHVPQLGEGRLDLIMGPMFAGKTTALINQVQQVSDHQDRLAVAVKSSKDERYGNHWIVTHDGRCMRCYTTDTLAELRALLGPAFAKFQVLAIDEAQFFPDLVEFCQEAVDVDGKHVIVAGLSGDFKRQRFGQLLELMPLADNITQLKSQCAFCNEDALFSLRLTGVGGPQALVGGDDKYKATCRRCYLQHTTTMQ